MNQAWSALLNDVSMRNRNLIKGVVPFETDCKTALSYTVMLFETILQNNLNKRTVARQYHILYFKKLILTVNNLKMLAKVSTINKPEHS